jgi:hypothetical protein
MISKLIMDDRSVILSALIMITGVKIDNNCKLGMFNPIIVKRSIVIIDTKKIAIAM